MPPEIRESKENINEAEEILHVLFNLSSKDINTAGLPPNTTCMKGYRWKHIALTVTLGYRIVTSVTS